jgi:hypothetical protein
MPTILKRSALAAGAAALAVYPVATAGPAIAGTSNYASWDQSGNLGVAAVGFPSGQWTSTAANPRVPSGASTFLNAATPTGQAFGSSQGANYLLVGPGKGGVAAPSATQVTFDTPPKAGTWGFTLGDVDAEAIQVQAFDAAGNEVPVSDLGFQGAFNFCNGVSPRPSTCMGQTATDTPVWNASTGVLKGNVLDTNGASGWFRPEVAIKSLVFNFTVQSGFPAYQIWIAANDQPTSPVGNVEPPTPVPPIIVPDTGETVIPIPPVVGPDPHLEVVEPPKHGTVEQKPDGTVVYIPKAGFIGTDSAVLEFTGKNGKVVVHDYKFKVVKGLPDTGARDVPAEAAAAFGLVLTGLALRRVSRPTG